MSKRKSKRGNIMLLAIMVMMLISMVITLLTKEIVLQIKSTKDSYDSIQGKYLAESGIENFISEATIEGNSGNAIGVEYDLIYEYLKQLKAHAILMRTQNGNTLEDKNIEEINNDIDEMINNYEELSKNKFELLDKIEKLDIKLQNYDNILSIFDKKEDAIKNTVKSARKYAGYIKELLNNELVNSNPEIDQELLKSLLDLEGSKYGVSIRGLIIDISQNIMLNFQTIINNFYLYEGVNDIQAVQGLMNSLETDGEPSLSTVILYLNKAQNDLNNENILALIDELTLYSEVRIEVIRANNIKPMEDKIIKSKEGNDNYVSSFGNREYNADCALNLLELVNQDLKIIETRIKMIKRLLGAGRNDDSSNGSKLDYKVVIPTKNLDNFLEEDKYIISSVIDSENIELIHKEIMEFPLEYDESDFKYKTSPITVLSSGFTSNAKMKKIEVVLRFIVVDENITVEIEKWKR